MKDLRFVERRLPWLTVCLMITLGVSGCQDLQDDPVGVSVAPEVLDALLGSDELWSVPLEQGEGALARVLASAVELGGLTIPEVAGELVERASLGFRRIEGTPAYSKEELTRIRRLAFGAEEAFARGDYPGAIRRAYYACQLLGIGP